MQIGIFAFAGDEQACRLERALNAQSPGTAAFFDLSLGTAARATMGAGEAAWGGRDLTKLDIAFLHGFAYCDPVIPACGTGVDWSVWRFDYIAAQQKHTFLYSLFSELERRGVRVISPPAAHLQTFMKPLLLERLRRAGLNVPAAVCSNNMDAVREFCGRHANAVWRPATGRAAYQRFTDRQREALVSLQKPPIIVAEAVDGPVVRGYLLQGEPLLFLEKGAPDCTGEERLEGFWEVDYAALRPDLSRLAAEMNIPWLEVVFVAKDGKAWIYDVDADPLFEGLPTGHSEKLTALLAKSLLQVGQTFLSADAVAAPPAKAVETQRPTLFLRRMLRILFEFEQSKYSK
ncbi:MAG: hypothetical protein NTW87_19350 [Planctomycetota bacterium]|nr:hypothetical protein [Planctomycetota bacterium]